MSVCARQNILVYSDLKLVHHFDQFLNPYRFPKELISEPTTILQFFSWPRRVSIKNYFSKNDVQAIGFHFPE